MNNKSHFNTWQLLALIALVVIVNASGMLFPILRNDDPTLYANIAKRMVLSNDWVNLVFNNSAWLDKPHFPFWLTALSFKLFGINSWAYILPGFLFNLLGAYYTYLLGQHLYNKDIGLVAALISLSSLHLLLSSIDVRAEAYLLGEIMPACYYWYLYHEHTKFKYLVLGAVFTALALMTKGLFVLITITSGLIVVWAYTGQLNNFIRVKWLLALILSFLFITPELTCLYWQFDLHPNTMVFGHTHVSGLRWFFWDSQFGRFFNQGPITTSHVSAFHYLFFIHTFLWTFLPWSIVFLISVWEIIKSLLGSNANVATSGQKLNYLYLLGCFIPTFILFSATSFQLDYYTNILIPFAAIIVANWLYQSYEKEKQQLALNFQVWLAVILTLLVITLSIFVFGTQGLLWVLGMGLLMMILFIAFIHQNEVIKAILYPVLAICLVFLFVMLVYGQIYAKYDVGYQMANYLKAKPNYPVIDYHVNSLTLEFYSKDPYVRVDNLQQLSKLAKPYYLVINSNQLPSIANQLTDRLNVLTRVKGTTINKVMDYLLAKPRLKSSLTDYLIIQVN